MISFKYSLLNFFKNHDISNLSEADILTLDDTKLVNIVLKSSTLPKSITVKS